MTSSKRPPAGVLDRGLWLLSQFSMERKKLPLKELASLSGLDKATALRLLKVLVDWGYLVKNADGSYSPGPSNLRLASIYRATSNTITRIEAPIARISERVGQTTAFFVRSGEERICLARDHAYQDFRYFIEVGGSVSLSEGGAAAQLLMAYSGEAGERHDETRGRGYYISRGERNRHFASVAMPLFESDGQFLGALTITGLAVDLPDDDLIGFVDIVRAEVAGAGLSLSR
ncbi:IclR family transcriptional regulator [Notoacmeibacter sp. MSK16QG-6]|uniref:IclR family transcriptional regulator n=1 Tax=Notoacmeibacter sp. MSK16QG-6 TaxID=2957982 RepID=UPI0020A21074|nr:helix-turn-helix domain-containing protein [Notoacmeibacter sp. MSK16QG-6]MCP1200555.1 helix-turn-helix domain-containing protein [Notoacmeibacter sp. MSK16QG-6]